MTKTAEQIQKELEKPFLKEVNGVFYPDFYWRVSHSYEDNQSKTGRSALMVPYIDARHVYGRLNDVVGVNWAKQTTAFLDGAKCTISIKIDGKWIERDGMSGQTKIEPEKGAESKSAVRAGVPWGIGAYLYSIGNVTLPAKIESVNGGRASAQPYDKTGKVLLFTKESVSDYINMRYSIPAMKFAELTKALSESEINELKPELTKLWNCLKK